MQLPLEQVPIRAKASVRREGEGGGRRGKRDGRREMGGGRAYRMISSLGSSILGS